MAVFLGSLVSLIEVHACFSASILLFVCFFLSFWFLWIHLIYTEVPSLGVESELQMLAHGIATAMQDLSCICELYHSSQQCQYPIHWVRPGIKPTSAYTIWICFCCTTWEILPCCFDYHCFVLEFEVWEDDESSFALSLAIALAIENLFSFHIIFYIVYSSSVKTS